MTAVPACTMSRAAWLLGVHPDTVHDLIADGTLHKCALQATKIDGTPTTYPGVTLESLFAHCPEARDRINPTTAPKAVVK